MFEYTDISTAYGGLQELTFPEYAILTLAIFRLTRLFVYDSVAQFIRDIFLDKEEYKKRGVIMVKRTKPASGLRRLFADLLSCPWCSGVWISMFTIIIFITFPQTWFFWLFMSIAGLSSLIQIFANRLRWQAEKAKLEAGKLSK